MTIEHGSQHNAQTQQQNNHKTRMQTQAHVLRLTRCKHPQADAQDAAASTANASMPLEAACNSRAASSGPEWEHCSNDSSESGDSDSEQGDQNYEPTGMATQSRDRCPKFMKYMSGDAAPSVFPSWQTVAGTVLHNSVLCVHVLSGGSIGMVRMFDECSE